VLKCLDKNKSINCVAHYVIMNQEEPQNNEPASASVRSAAPAEACVTFLNCSLSISLIHKVADMSSGQAKITRNIPIKIALKLPKSLFTQKLLVIQHNAFCSMVYTTVTVRNDRLLQPHNASV